MQLNVYIGGYSWENDLRPDDRIFILSYTDQAVGKNRTIKLEKVHQGIKDGHISVAGLAYILEHHEEEIKEASFRNGIESTQYT